MPAGDADGSEAVMAALGLPTRFTSEVAKKRAVPSAKAKQRKRQKQVKADAKSKEVVYVAVAACAPQLACVRPCKPCKLALVLSFGC